MAGPTTGAIAGTEAPMTMTSDLSTTEDGRMPSLTPATDDAQGLLDLLLAHKSQFIREFLAQHDLPHSGAKAALRARLQQGLDANTWQQADLQRLLETVEGWGNQHVTLYQAPAGPSRQWMDEATAHATLARLGLDSLLNARRSAQPPAELTLSSVSWTPDRLRVGWVQGQTSEERLPEQDVHQDSIVLRAYRVSTSRWVYTFDWDLLTGQAVLMIPRLPSTRQVQRMRARLAHELKPLVDLDLFTLVRVNLAIRRIELSGEARCRQVRYETSHGSRLELTSPAPAQAVAVDPAMERVGAILPGQASGLLGDFFWPSSSRPVGREVHTKIYGLDQRVAFIGETTEGDFRYVLSRIFHHSKAAS